MWAISLLLSGAVAAASAEPARAQADDAPSFVVRAKKARVDGATVVDDAVLLVEAGRIRAVGAGLETERGLALIEHDGFVSAGLIACHGFSGTRGDVAEPKRSVTPQARVIDVFDPGHADFERARRAGITTLVLTPSNANLIGGVSAVVKTAGGRVLADEGHLALSLCAAALRPNRYPTSAVGAVNELEQRFAEPQGVFERAAAGELAVLIETITRDDVQRALAFAARHKLRGALYGGSLAGDLAAEVAQSGLALIVRPMELGESSRTLKSIAQLAAAKVPLAFGADAPWNSNESPRWTAAMCVRAGVDAAVAWDGLTVQAARVAGCEERIGKLERGFDADFVLWSGDPLDLTSEVEAVYVDGRLVWGGQR